MGRVTAILLSYKRPENIPIILDSLRVQTEKPDIMLINNGGFQTFGVKKTVHIPWNAGAWIRHPFAVCTQTPFVMFLDDDLIPTDPDFVRDMMYICDLHRDGITGIFGKCLGPEPYYYSKAPDATEWVHIVKGRCMMLGRSLFERVTFGNITRPITVAHEDVYLSLEIGRGERAHWVDPGLQGRIENLPEPFAESKRPQHYPERDAMVAWHLEKFALDDVLYRAERLPHLCTRAEMRHLWQCAMKAPEHLPMVECGCYMGSSAVVLADAAYRRGAPLTLIDSFVYGTPLHGVNSAEVVRSNLARSYVPVMPRLVQGKSVDVPDGLDQVGFLHVDTEHKARVLNAELDEWLPRMAPGSVIAFHDYSFNSPEMAPVIDKRIGENPDWECLGLVRWMICYQKKSAENA